MNRRAAPEIVRDSMRLRAARGSAENVATGATYSIGRATLVHADCFDWLRVCSPRSIHAVVTDPPYGLLEYSHKEQAKLRNGRGDDPLPVTEHGRPVADLVDLLKVVRDVEDRDTARGELPDPREQPLDGATLQRRQQDQPALALAISWKAQQRLHHIWRRLDTQRGKRKTLVAVAVARHLAGFCWAITNTDPKA